MRKILANDGIDLQGKALLEKAGFTVITEKVPQEKLAEYINSEQIVGLTVRSATKVRKDVIDAVPGLRLIGRGGVGMDNIDVDYAKSKGIIVVNTPAASSMSVAELVFAHLFSAARFLYDANRHMPQSGHTQFDTLKKKYAKGIELRNKSLGIVGFGRIGQSVAKMGLGLGMKILAYDPYVKEANIDIEVHEVGSLTARINTITLDQLLQESDMITLHVPGGSLITSREFGMMKNGVIIANAARGGVINEHDLIAALDSGKVAHACLDVFDNEPTPSPDILKHPKISLTPHIGASTEEAQERIGIELAEKIIESLK